MNATLVKFRLTQGGHVYINPMHVSSVTSGNSTGFQNAVIHCAGQYYLIDESPADIVERLTTAAD